MDFEKICEELAQEFVQNPINFVTEFDLQSRLQHLIRKELEIKKAAMKNPELAETTNGYKQAYWKRAQERLKDQGQIDRVHTEVSLVGRNGEKDKIGGRLDVVVFNETIENRIIWDNGSKRFSVNDVSSAFELKFVKNRPKFPTKTGDKVNNLEGESREKLLRALDFDSNKIVYDLKELRKE